MDALSSRPCHRRQNDRKPLESNPRLWNYIRRHPGLFAAAFIVAYGIDTRVMLALAFATSAIVGAIAGILITPITLTRFDLGIMMTIRGFAAAMLGGIGSPLGAVVGGAVLGMLEALGAGYISTAYKDAIAFVAILLTFGLRPNGLFGRKTVERV